MDSINVFFVSIGLYNLLGVLILALFINRKLADFVLTKHFQIFSENYSVGKHGNMWLIWSIVLNLFFAIINLLAIRWDEIAQHDLLKTNILMYLAFFILTIFAVRSTSYSRGVWFNFLIFGFWIVWASYLLL